MGIRKPRHDRDGYARLNAQSGGKIVTFRVSCLVAEAFHGPKPEGMVVRHLDGNNGSDRADNLAYGTVEDNLDDQKAHGTFPNKITEEQALEVRRRALSGESMSELAEEFGLHYQTIFRIKRGLRWRRLPMDKAA